jgi:hypothetical protein
MFLNDGKAGVNYAEVQLEKSRTMAADTLLDLVQSLCLIDVLVCVFIRQHDETFMIIDSSQGTKVCGRFVAGIKMGKTNKQ